MKAKTRKSRSRNFPLHDAIAIQCSEKGFSLLQWGFNPKDLPNKFPRYSLQMPTEAANQIIEWRNIELNYRSGQGVI